MIYRLMRSTALAALCVGTVMPLSGVYAATIDAAGAEHLRSFLEKAIADQKAAIAVSSGAMGADLIADGPVVVEPAGTYYAATLPPLRVVVPITTDTSQKTVNMNINIGMIALNASPQETPGLWNVALALPSPMFATAQNPATGENVRMDLTIGEQKFAGVLDEKFVDAVGFGQGFVSSILDYKNINLAIQMPKAKAPLTINMGDMHVHHTYTTDATGHFSGPFEMSLRDISLQTPPASPEGSTNLRLGALRVSGTIQAFDPAVFKTSKDKMMTLTKDMRAKTPSVAPTSEEMGGLFLAMAQMYTSMFNGFDVQYALEDFSLDATFPATSEGTAPKKQHVGLAKAGISVGVSDVRTDKAGFSKKLSYDGLVINPLPAGIGDLIPTTVTLEFVSDGVPVKTLVASAATALEGAQQNPAQAEMMWGAFVAKIPGLLATAGSGMKLQNGVAKNALYTVDLTGHVKADITAAMGALGSFDIRVAGLDALITKLQGPATDPSAGMMAAMMGGNLQAAQAMGKKQENGSYTYAFELDAKGQILLNGTVFSNAMANAATTPTPPVETIPGEATPAVPSDQKNLSPTSTPNPNPTPTLPTTTEAAPSETMPMKQ